MLGSRIVVAVVLGGIGTCVGIETARADAVVTFDNGNEGWDGPIDTALGNAAPSWHFGPGHADGFVFGTTTNAAFLGDYSRSPRIELGSDILPRNLGEWGGLYLEISDTGFSRFDWASVWTSVSTFGEDEWQQWSVLIDDTSAAEIPRGWYGISGVNSSGLPPGRTFASLLASVDAVRLASFPPGTFVGGDPTIHDVAFDNVFIRSLPRLGDANADGVVDRLDAATVAVHFGMDRDATLADGDFDGSDGVNLLDWSILQRNLDPGTSGSPMAAHAAVPEPTTASLAFIALGCLVVLHRGRNPSQPLPQRSVSHAGGGTAGVAVPLAWQT